MAFHPKEKLSGRRLRQVRVRKRVVGTGERPRLSVYRSARHIYAQVIDDAAGVTLAAASTRSAALSAELAGKKKVEVAKLVGEAVGRLAAERGIETVVFDRNGYKYHGRVQAVAEGARAAGLRF